MSNTPHELAEEFPEYKDRIHDLKVSDAHFRKLFDEYHEINREVHRTEAAGHQRQRRCLRGHEKEAPRPEG
jgi:uncharacterized protein YdcH (DUF465 family)